MPAMTRCTSCGKRCRRYPDTAEGGPLCFSCRTRVCLGCGQVIASDRRRRSAWCSASCRVAHAGVAA